MNISYEGIGHLSVTFPTDNCAAGQVCGLNGEGKVCACPDGGKVLGLVESVNGNAAGVQIAGFAKVAYSGTAPAMGNTKLSADGLGGMKEDAAGNTYWIVNVDTVNKTVTVKL